MSLTAQELHRITAHTLAHCDRHALPFLEGTCDHDIGQSMDALLRQIDAPPPFTLPDFGCGPGWAACGESP